MAHQLTWHDEADSPLPNMRITVTGDDASKYEFLIYTVQQGTLADYRIVKYRMGDMRSFKGFAFLMSDGTLKLWRSQDVLAGTLIVRLAEGAMKSYAGSVSSGFRTSTRYWEVSTITQCLRCNLPTAHTYCMDHDSIARDLREQIEADERATRYTQQRARRIVSSTEHNFVVTDRPEDISDIIAPRLTELDPQPIRRPVDPAPVVSRLPLSENGTGLVR